MRGSLSCSGLSVGCVAEVFDRIRIEVYHFAMKKIISFVLVAVFCISAAMADRVTSARVTVPEDISSFDLRYSRYYHPELGGSGEDGEYTIDDRIIIHEGVSSISLYNPSLPEDLLSRRTLFRIATRPFFQVAEGNSRYFSDYLGLLYEKLSDGKLRLLSVPTGLDFSDDEIIPRGMFVIPPEIASIGPAATIGCDIDRTIAIPETLTDIDETAFIGSGIRGFVVHPDNPRYASIDGSLYDKAAKKLLYAAWHYSDPFFEVPDGIRGIADYAFLDSNIQAISIPSSVEDVSPLSFAGALEEGRLSLTVSMISGISLRGNSGRLKLVHDDPLLTSGEPWSVAYIIVDDVLVAALQAACFDEDGYRAVNEFWGKGDELFPKEYYYTGFSELEIPDGARSIGPYAFFGLNTETLSVPGSVKIIEGSAFAGADIDNLKLNEGTERITGYDGDLPYLSETRIPASLKELFGFLPSDAEKLVAGHGTDYDASDLIYGGPSAVSTGDRFHVSKDSPFYRYFMAIDPYAVENTSWLVDKD